MMPVLPSVCAFLVAVGYLVVRVRALRSQELWLYETPLLWIGLYLTGATVLCIRDGGRDAAHLVLLTSLTMSSATIAAAMILPSRLAAATATVRDDESFHTRIAWLVGALAAAVCVLFVVLVVRNDELSLMVASLLTGDGTALELRKAITTGSAVYLAPGYVKQFREVLLPMSLVFLIGSSRTRNVLGPSALLLAGFAAAVLSGQRSAVLIYFFAVGAGLYFRTSGRGGLRTTAVGALAVLGFAAFLGVTLMLGRTSGEEGAAALLFSTTVGLFERVVTVVPGENLSGYRLWSAMAPSYGASWLSDLASVLPGIQSGISNQLHQLAGGSAEGNSPLGMAPDLYLAWGAAGTVLFPPVFVIALWRWERKLLLSGAQLGAALRAILYPLSFAWYSPFLFLLNGGAVLLAAVAALSILKGLRRE